MQNYLFSIYNKISVAKTFKPKFYLKLKAFNFFLQLMPVFTALNKLTACIILQKYDSLAASMQFVKSTSYESKKIQ